jgi:Mce-associated membrane protein
MAAAAAMSAYDSVHPDGVSGGLAETQYHDGGVDVAEPDPAGPGEDEPGSTVNPSVGYLAVLVALTGVVLVLIGFGSIFGWRLLEANAKQARRDLVLHTAHQAAGDLTTIDYRTADQDVRRLLDGSTEDFAAAFGIGTPEFLDVVKRTQLVSTGQSTSAGIERMDEHSAWVLVAVNASVREVGAPGGAPRNYRLRVELVPRADRWLVSKVEFIL